MYEYSGISEQERRSWRELDHVLSAFHGAVVGMMPRNAGRFGLPQSYRHDSDKLMGELKHAGVAPFEFYWEETLPYVAKFANGQEGWFHVGE